MNLEGFVDAGGRLKGVKPDDLPFQRPTHRMQLPALFDYQIGLSE
jgi:hypothetical protein